MVWVTCASCTDARNGAYYNEISICWQNLSEKSLAKQQGL